MDAGDGAPEYRESRFEMERPKSHYRPNQSINFYLYTAEGHDDSVMSLVLVVKAASGYEPHKAKGN